MQERFAATSGRAELEWDPGRRLATLRFADARKPPTEEDAIEVTRRMAAWAGPRPLRILVDCDNVASTTAGWRSACARFFKERGWRDSVAWARMTPLISVMASMFLRATRINAKGFATLAEAEAWLLLQPVEAPLP